MNFLLTHLAINPGPYTPPAVTAAPESSIPWALVVAGGFAFVGILFLFADYAEVAVLFLVAALVFLLVGVSELASSSDESDKATKHEQSVKAKAKYDADYEGRIRSWLHDEYGITANPKGVHQLRTGKNLVADTSSGQHAIRLADTVDGDLAVQIVGGDVIQPNNTTR